MFSRTSFPTSSLRRSVIRSSKLRTPRPFLSTTNPVTSNFIRSTKSLNIIPNNKDSEHGQHSSTTPSPIVDNIKKKLFDKVVDTVVGVPVMKTKNNYQKLIKESFDIPNTSMKIYKHPPIDRSLFKRTTPGVIVVTDPGKIASEKLKYLPTGKPSEKKENSHKIDPQAIAKRQQQMLQSIMGNTPAINPIYMLAGFFILLLILNKK